MIGFTTVRDAGSGDYIDAGLRNDSTPPVAQVLMTTVFKVEADGCAESTAASIVGPGGSFLDDEALDTVKAKGTYLAPTRMATWWLERRVLSAGRRGTPRPECHGVSSNGGEWDKVSGRPPRPPGALYVISPVPSGCSLS